MEQKNQLHKQTPTNLPELLKEISDSSISPSTEVAQVREMGYKPLSSLVVNGDKSDCYKVIKMIIVRINQFYGVTWNDFQITQTAKILYDNHYFFSAADWWLLSEKCMAGFYNFDKNNKIYGSYSPQNLIRWAQMYEQSWMEYSESLSISEHKQLQQPDSEGIAMPEFVKDFIADKEAKNLKIIKKNKLNHDDLLNRKNKFNELHEKVKKDEITPQQALIDYYDYLEKQKKEKDGNTEKPL